MVAPSRTFRFISLCTVVLLCAVSADAVDIPINSKAAYLHVCSDPADVPVPIVLADIGFGPGDWIQIEALGEWDNGPGAEIYYGTIGVFSASDVLLDPSLLNRVQDAIDAGDDTVTGSPYYCADPTDIPEDFRIAVNDHYSSIIIQIPVGATHLFVTAADNLYYDNRDTEPDYAVRITPAVLPAEKTTWGAIKSLYEGE